MLAEVMLVEQRLRNARAVRTQKSSGKRPCAPHTPESRRCARRPSAFLPQVKGACPATSTAGMARGSSPPSGAQWPCRYSAHTRPESPRRSALGGRHGAMEVVGMGGAEGGNIASGLRPCWWRTRSGCEPRRRWRESRGKVPDACPDRKRACRRPSTILPSQIADDHIRGGHLSRRERRWA